MKSLLKLIKRYKMNKERWIIVTILLLLITGIFLNYILSKSLNEKKDIVDITEKELRFMDYVYDDEAVEDRKELDEYLYELLEGPDLEDDERARVIYYMGLNNHRMKNFDKAIEQYNEAIDIFTETNNYAYLITAYTDLMNLYYVKVDQISALECSDRIFSILSNNEINWPVEDQERLLKIRVRVLSGLTTTTSSYGINEVSKKYYDELVEVTEKNKVDDNINIYAKYQYNLFIGNYEEAKKYALEYIKHFEGYEEVDYNGAHIYLLESLIYKGEFENIQEVFDIVEKAYKEMNIPLYTATLDKFKGMYHEKLGNYQEALMYYEKSLENYDAIEGFNYSVEVNDRIITLNRKFNKDVKKYLERAEEYSANYNYKSKVGAISGSLVDVAFQKTSEDTIRVTEQAELIEGANNISKNMSIIYIIIIILASSLIKMLKNEIKTRKEKEEELEYMVKTDYLTKAYSKKYCFDKINELINNKSKFTFVLFDLDNFKSINDKYGHYFGDEVLRNVVSVAKKVINDKGFVGRFGGEEFILVLEDDNVNNILDEIRSQLKLVEWSEKDAVVTISGGKKLWNGETTDELIKEADSLLYKAKKSGKDKIL